MAQLNQVTRTIRKVQPTMIQLNAATGSGYNEEWTIKLQPGMTYHSIELDTNLKTVATIKKVTIDIGGTPVAYATNVMLDLMDKLYKKHQKEGRFVFDLSKFEYRTPAGIYQTQLVTGLRDDVTVKVEFGAKAANDPVVPVLKSKAWVSDNDGAGRVFVPTRYELTQYAAAAGEHTWTFPNGSPNRHIQRIIFNESDVTISKIRVKRGTRTIHTLERDDLDYMLQRHAGVALQAGYCLLDFTAFGFGIHGAIHTHGLSFELDVDGTGAIKTYVEGFEQKLFPQAA